MHRGAPEEFTIFHGDWEVPQIALSVDDCYKREHVSEILALCKEYNIPVTFFVIGKVLAEKDQNLWQRAIDLGCEPFQPAHPEPGKKQKYAEQNAAVTEQGAELPFPHAADAAVLG